MKDRLSIADWTAVVFNAAGGSLVALLGRLVQVVAVVIVCLTLWPTLAAVITWLKVGAWVVPTPMGITPEAARAVTGSTDWVIFRSVLAWLATHHVLWTGVPLAVLTGALGQGIVALGRARSGRAGDIVSLSLRDEYVLRETWARWRPRLLALLVVAVLGISAVLAFFSSIP